MSFLRHGEIYRSDVGAAVRQGFALASPGIGSVARWPASRLESAGLHENGERSQAAFPVSSSTMSLEPAIPWRVGLHQSPPPLHRPTSMLHRSAGTVNHHLAGGGEFSTGGMGKFQPALTLLPPYRNSRRVSSPLVGRRPMGHSLWSVTRISLADLVN